MNEQSMGNTDRDLVDPNLSGSSIDFSIDDSFANAADDSGKRKINASTILFGCVLVASVVSLWSMRTLSRSSAGMIESGESVKEVREWVWARSNDGSSVSLGGLEIIDRLDKDRLNAMQVPLAKLGNQFPFRYEGEGSSAAQVSSTTSKPKVNERDKQMDQWEQTIDGIGQQMKVTAIMAPDSPRAQAVLNGQRLMLGDVFYVEHMGEEHAFQVERISRDGLVFLTRNHKLQHERRIEVGVDHGW